MAILSKIRERSMFLVIIIGLALFAFVASPKDIFDFFNSNNINSVGEINGEKISIKDFATRMEIYKSNSSNKMSEMQIVNMVWNNILNENIYKKQLDEAGIVVGEKDVWENIVQIPSIKNAELFKNEIGLFDEEKFKEYLANLKENSKNQPNSGWSNWIRTEKSIKTSLERTTYGQLVKQGIIASLKEGERKYLEEATKLTGSYVYIPYNSIQDSLVKVTPADINTYVKNHKSEFLTEASRDIKYVKFDIVASKKDENDIKEDLLYLTKEFQETNSYDLFLNDNESDIPFDSKYIFKKDLPSIIADKVFNAKKGTIIGPYKFENHYKISKVLNFMKIPDSVKASHILISYIGSRSANETEIRTENQAKKLADSILKIVKKNNSKFETLAKEFSSDKSSANAGGDLNWFGYSKMVPEFRNYTFENKKGTIGIIRTIFGFHIIKIADQKNIQKAVQLATFAKKIVASESTENSIFEKAETLTYELSSTKDKNIDDLSKEYNYVSIPLVGIKRMEENISELGKNRAIVIWAFDKERIVNDVKRFDLEEGYAVVVLTNKTEKGVYPTSKVTNKVKPILIKQKKAILIAEKMNGNDLKTIANNNKTSVKAFSDLSLRAPTIPGVGIEPNVVGAMYAVEEGKVISNIVGEKGVFAIKISKKEIPPSLPNYEGYRNSITKELQNKISGQIYETLKELSEIKDERHKIY